MGTGDTQPVAGDVNLNGWPCFSQLQTSKLKGAYWFSPIRCLSLLYVLIYHYRKQVDCIQKLLEKGALPNTPNKSGVIPLHIAVGHPCIDSVQYLILHGSDVNLKVSA